MLPSTLRISLIVGIVVYFVILLIFLKNKALQLRYTLLWMFAGIVLLVLTIWPELLSRFIHLFGIVDNMNGLFLMLFAFALMILMSLTSIVSKQADKIRNLTQTIARMEKRIRDLERDGTGK